MSCLFNFFHDFLFSMCVDKGKTLLSTFSQVSWLASASNSCAIVRALFINICKKLIQWMQTVQCDDVCDLILWLRDEVQNYAASPPVYQVSNSCMESSEEIKVKKSKDF